MIGRKWKTQVGISLSKVLISSVVTASLISGLGKLALVSIYRIRSTSANWKYFNVSPTGSIPWHCRRELWKLLQEAAKSRTFGDHSFGSSISVTCSWLLASTEGKKRIFWRADNPMNVKTWCDSADHEMPPVQYQWQYVPMLPKSSMCYLCVIYLCPQFQCNLFIES